MNSFTKILHRKAAIAGALICIIIGASACHQSLTSVNTNTNAPTSATNSSLLTAGELDLAQEYWGIFPLGYFGNLYAEYWSEDQYTEESRYQYRQQAVVNGMFNQYYLALNTLQKVIEKNRNGSNPNAGQIAVVQVLKAWTFETLTDIYGSVPYNEALGGSANPSPKYSSQKYIYSHLIDTLQHAANTLKSINGKAFNSGDIFYSGNAKKWKKFANSLIMRLAIREADAVTDGSAAKAFRTAFKSEAMSSNADNAIFPFSSNPAQANPIWRNYVVSGRNDWGVSKVLIDFMNQNNDPRRSAYAAPAIKTNPPTYIGFPYGLNPANAGVFRTGHAWSKPSKRVRQATSPAIFMTYSETLFNMAEAAQRGWLDPIASAKSAAKYYKMAIKASMHYWGVDDAGAIHSYISAHPYKPGNWQIVLGRQKWVALYMQGLQGWSVARRLDIGILIPPVDGCIYCFETDLPVRLPYPTQEHTLNGKHVKQAISAQGFSSDNQGQRLWWDEAAQGK